MCDVAYVAWLDLVRERAAANFQVTVIVSALGGKVEIVDPEDSVAAFDAWLLSDLTPAEPSDPAREALHKALGVR